jgi:hypothetical protein
MSQNASLRRVSAIVQAALVAACVPASGCMEIDMSDAPAQLDDDFKEVPDDEYVDKATLPTDGTLVSGDINFAGDFDWHSFYLPASATCTIETVLGTTTGSLSDSVIALYGPNSTTTYITEDDDSGPGLASLIVRSLGGGASYYVKARGFGASTGTYQIRVTCGCANPTSQVPAMTGPGTPSGSVTRSGVYDASYEGWLAFDASATSQWISEVWVAPAWLAYAWPDGARTITSYAVHFANGSLTSRAPRDWTLQGWNGSAWVVVDTRSNQINWAGTETRSFNVASPGAYTSYRLHVTQDNDARADIVVISIAGLTLNGCR